MTNWTHVDYIRWQAPKGAKVTDYPVELRMLQLDENGASIASCTLYGCYACGNVYETADAAKGCGHDRNTRLRMLFSGGVGAKLFVGMSKDDADEENQKPTPSWPITSLSLMQDEANFDDFR